MVNHVHCRFRHFYLSFTQKNTKETLSYVFDRLPYVLIQSVRNVTSYSPDVGSMLGQRRKRFIHFNPYTAKHDYSRF